MEEDEESVVSREVELEMINLVEESAQVKVAERTQWVEAARVKKSGKGPTPLPRHSQ
jgi:predicted transcriptional regulator